MGTPGCAPVVYWAQRYQDEAMSLMGVGTPSCAPVVNWAQRHQDAAIGPVGTGHKTPDYGTSVDGAQGES